MATSHNFSKLLINEPALQVLPSLACAIGLNEAMLLQQIHYWLLRPNAKIRDGRRWLYNSYPEWQEQFPFWSVSTIRRIIGTLEKKGLLLSGNYNDLKVDQTKWYTIDYEALEALAIPPLDAPPAKPTRPSAESRKPSAHFEQANGSERADHDSNMSRPIPETNTETNTETTLESATAPRAPAGRKLTPGVNTPKPTPATPLPRDWVFDPALRDWALHARGLTPDQADDEHDQFCAHYWSVAHDKKRGWRSDWTAAEHGWFLRREQFAPPQKGLRRDNNVIPPDKLTAKLQGIAGRIAALNGADGTPDDDVPGVRALPIAR